MDAEALRNLRKENRVRADLDNLGWYHSFRFPDGSEFRGILPVERSEYRYSKFPLPEDLGGRTVLDIGAWDGWFSFEAERHGAQVTAVDVVEVQNFWKVHRKLGSRAAYHELNLFDIPEAKLGTFDYVFFLGVLYHTRHPLLALEIVCGLTRELAIVESYVTDAVDWEIHRENIPTLEFYETDELGGQLDNWFGPTVGCLIAMCRSAGFARVEVLHVEDNRAALACYRKWGPIPVDAAAPAVRIRSLQNTVKRGINFRANREEYLTVWFDVDVAGLTRDDIRIEVGDLAVPVMYTARDNGSLWFANSLLPHGIAPGWHPVRMSVCNGPWTAPVKIAVDIEARADALEIRILADGRTWERDQVSLSCESPHVSVWVAGLAENSDVGNTKLLLDRFPLRVDFVGEPNVEGVRQINAEIPADTEPGVYSLVARFAGVDSLARDLTVRR